MGKEGGGRYVIEFRQIDSPRLTVLCENVHDHTKGSGSLFL